MTGRDTVQALERGIAIVEAVADSEEGLSLSALARRLGVRPSTAHNLVRTLMLCGWIDRREPPVRYRLGPAVAQLIRRHERRHLVEAAASLLMEWAPRLPEAVLILAEPLGGDIVASLRMDTTPPAILERSPHWVMPPYTTAVTLCYLAFWPRSETELYRRRYAFSEYGRARWATEAKLATFLNDSRRRGYVLVETDPPWRAAVPVRLSSGRCLAVLGVSLHDEGTSDDRRRQLALEMLFSGGRSLCTAVERGQIAS